MKKLLVRCALIQFVLMAQPAFPQDNYSRTEIFGGFSILPANGDDFPRETSYGFQASVCSNLNRWFGVVADFGGQYRTVSNLGPGFPGLTAKTSVYEYMAGPRFTARSGRTSLFGHALFGGAKGNSGLNGFSDSAIALGGGGGLDINLNDRVAIRTFQLDLIGSFVDILEANTRFGFGVVMKFGGS